jgi:glutamate--cysteine ligase catalytic subunit
MLSPKSPRPIRNFSSSNCHATLIDLELKQMGLLAVGQALTWEEAKQQADYVRWHGIQQFLNVWNALKDRNGDGLLWGDEVTSLAVMLSFPGVNGAQIEYIVVSMDEANQNARLSLRQSEILVELATESQAAAAEASPQG